MKSLAQTLYETCKDFEDLSSVLLHTSENLESIEYGIETLGSKDGRAYSFHNGNNAYTFKDGSVLYTRHYKPHGFKESTTP